MSYLFDIWYFCYDKVVEKFQLNDVEESFRVFIEKQNESCSVADIGGGTGSFAQRLMEEGFNVTIIDPSKNMTDLALQKDPRIQVLNAFAEKTGCAAESFDAVCLIDSLHHFRNVHDSIFEAVRILKPKGLIFIKEFNPQSFKIKLLWLFELFCFEKPRFFKPAELYKLMNRQFDGEIQKISEEEYIYIGRLREF